MKDLLEGKSDPVVSARLLTEKYLCPEIQHGTDIAGWGHRFKTAG